MSKKKQKNTEKPAQQKVRKKTWFSDKPVVLISIKSLIVLCFFTVLIAYIDSKGYFNPNETNNHTKRKWDSFYSFTDDNNVDILLLGNSHLYTGINPKNLSVTLGANAFILASPGTHIGDTYYALKEALKKTQAKLVVIETYGINDFNPYGIESQMLSDQFKSFYARKDFMTKILSTPFLFSSKNYVYAWSNTIRNHDFLFNDTAQLSINKKLIKDPPPAKPGLYLGRYVRFQTGITDSLIARYDSLGAPVKGKEYTYSDYAEKYVEKIVNLCAEEGVELIFLTLPMYEKHIDSYESWDEKLSKLLDQYPNKWINMQKSPGYDGFGTFAFQNTYGGNQHMTYNGSLMATYKLAGFIRDSLSVELPQRQSDQNWLNLFYGQEGYFEHFSPRENDLQNQTVCSEKMFDSIKVNNGAVIKTSNENVKIFMLKIDKESFNFDPSKTTLRVYIKVDVNGVDQVSYIDLGYDILHTPPDHFIFSSTIKPIKVNEIMKIEALSLNN